MITRSPRSNLPFLACAALAALSILAACRSPAATRGPTAECPVCKCEGDLACIQVLIEPDTPRCERDGRTHYFCSEECLDDFRRDPGRYR